MTGPLHEELHTLMTTLVTSVTMAALDSNL
jgi:hypothetical protein